MIVVLNDIKRQITGIMIKKVITEENILDVERIGIGTTIDMKGQ